MAKNLNRTRNASISVALPVAANTASGDIVPVGDQGLFGFALTDRATSDTIQAGTAAQGLQDGQATVELPGITLSVNLEIDGDPDIGDAIYRAANGDINTTNTGLFIGWFLGGRAVGLLNSAPSVGG